MLLRISLIVAILAGLAIGTLNFTKVKEKVVTLQTDLKNTQDELASTKDTLNTTKTKLANTESDLKRTKTQLADAKTERDQAVNTAEAAEKRAKQAADDLATARTQLDSTQAELERYRGTGFTPEQALVAAKTIKDLQGSVAGLTEENRVIGKKLRKAETELALIRDRDFRVPLPASLSGQVVVYDPKFEFVVLNVGEDQGVLEHGELLVSHNGKLVAKVVVRSVQKDRCIANIVPGWKITGEEIMEGDSVIPAFPAQS